MLTNPRTSPTNLNATTMALTMATLIATASAITTTTEVVMATPSPMELIQELQSFSSLSLHVYTHIIGTDPGEAWQDL